MLYRQDAIIFPIDHSFLKVQWRSYKKLYELLLSSITLTAIICVQPLAVIQIQIQPFGCNLAVVGLYLFAVYVQDFLRS